MVLGLGRKAKNTVDDVLETGEESGDSLASQGFFPTTLTKDQFKGPFSGTDMSPDEGRWVNLLYYEVGAQEQFVIGSKAAESEEIGKLNIKIVTTGADDGTSGEAPENARLRAGYETANGRASYPVFNKPAERLFNSDVEQRLQQAPKRWALMRDGERNGIAGQEDKIFINGYFTGTYTLDWTASQVQLPGMLKEE